MREPTPIKMERTAALPPHAVERLDGWAMMARCTSEVYRPSTPDGVRAVLEEAQRSGRTVIPRGSGFSYGDTSLNSENIVLDTGRMSRILDWDPAQGVISVEPGVTIGRLWRYVLEDGWWPRVVPGTMFPTLGGCASTNVHGKNHWREGSLGEQIVSVQMLLPSGQSVTCGPDDNPELFYAAVGGLGLLGIFTQLAFRLERVESGLLRVEEHAAPNLDAMFDAFEQNLDGADHLIGWVDAFASGAALGRGLVQAAFPGDGGRETLRASFQDLPDTFLAVVPRSIAWRALKPGANDAGVRVFNTARYHAGALRSGQSTPVPHAQFHFILDYFPNWKRVFQPGGIVQFQVFVPRDAAPGVFGSLLSGSQEAGHVPYLAVLKRHRPDPFLLSYSVDGYSLALDYHATPRNQDRLYAMLSAFTTQLVLPAGGRFYPAKDNALTRGALVQSLSADAVDRFLAVKSQVDPAGVLQGDLYRRVFL